MFQVVYNRRSGMLTVDNRLSPPHRGSGKPGIELRLIPKRETHRQAFAM